MMETALLDIVTPETVGDPMGQRKWVRCSLHKLSHGLAQAGYAASTSTVSRLLKSMTTRCGSTCKSKKPARTIQTVILHSTALKRKQKRCGGWLGDPQCRHAEASIDGGFQERWLGLVAAPHRGQRA
jgi:hypothetical protein